MLMAMCGQTTEHNGPVECIAGGEHVWNAVEGYNGEYDRCAYWDAWVAMPSPEKVVPDCPNYGIPRDEKRLSRGQVSVSQTCIPARVVDPGGDGLQLVPLELFANPVEVAGEYPDGAVVATGSIYIVHPKTTVGLGMLANEDGTRRVELVLPNRSWADGRHLQQLVFRAIGQTGPTDGECERCYGMNGDWCVHRCIRPNKELDGVYAGDAFPVTLHIRVELRANLRDSYVGVRFMAWAGDTPPVYWQRHTLLSLDSDDGYPSGEFVFIVHGPATEASRASLLDLCVTELAETAEPWPWWEKPVGAREDDDRDLRDFAVFQKCFGRYEAACSKYDVDGGGKFGVDLPDYSVFQAAFTGPRGNWVIEASQPP
jgi:hypothetical protein